MRVTGVGPLEGARTMAFQEAVSGVTRPASFYRRAKVKRDGEVDRGKSIPTTCHGYDNATGNGI